MSLYELKNTLLIAIIYVFRMLGLFMVIPILAIAWKDQSSISALQVGMAIGAYGFTQALLQIFLGWLSDIYGRKKIISLGLIVFAIGSFIAGYYNTVEGVILGRFIQGSGAIAGVLSALVSDITSIENLSKSMAIIGSSIGLSFILAMFLGPWIYVKFGISSIFLVNAIMALLALVIVIFFIPNTIQNNQATKKPSLLIQDIKNIIKIKVIPVQLFGVFTIHFVLMGIFIVIPKLLISVLGVDIKNHGYVYLLVNLISFAMCLPLIVYSEKQRKTKQIYLVSVSSLLVALFFMFFQSNYIMFALGLLFFFFGFTFLEATLPSLVAKYSPLLNKGTSMGLYSTCQFLGAALGSYINGLLLKNYGHDGLLIICSIIILVWLLLVIRMQQLQSIKSVVTVINKSTPTSIFEYLTKIRKVSGVIEAIVLPNNCKVCIKYDTEKLDNKNLECLGIVI
jgi:MFS family permease